MDALDIERERERKKILNKQLLLHVYFLRSDQKHAQARDQ